MTVKPPRKRRRRRRRKTSNSSSDINAVDTNTPPTSSGTKPQKAKRNRRRRNKGCRTVTEDISEEESSRYLALDCEMVGVGPGGYFSALARVCIIDWNENIVLDTFVKVTQPITDYRTFVSGIREEDLKSENAMDLKECRKKVASIIKGKIVIGHALINDFQALKLSHPWYDTRDTAKYAPLMKMCERTGSMKPRRLKDLVKEKLHKNIQCEGAEHCPVEDATATLSLYKGLRKKWERVMEYKYNKTLQIQMETSSASSDLSAEDYENILEFFASQ